MVRSRKGRPVFEGVKTVFLNLKTDQVNHSYISEYIKQHWGEEYALVTNEGTELEDSLGLTQGPILW